MRHRPGVVLRGMVLPLCLRQEVEDWLFSSWPDGAIDKGSRNDLTWRDRRQGLSFHGLVRDTRRGETASADRVD